MTIYEELISKVQDGWKFQISFKTKDIKVGNEYLVEKGGWNHERQLIAPATGDMLKMIEDLYLAYKYSRPTEKSETSKRKYFKALSTSELPDVCLAYGEDRSVRQAYLEGFVLCHVLSGNFQWKEEYGKWFWQSQTDNDLVILKDWVTM